MTLPASSVKQTYVGDGVTVTFSFITQTYTDSWIKVFEADVNGVETERTDFTVILSPDQQATPGGSVTFAVAPLATAHGVIYRATPVAQELAYRPYDPFPAESSELSLDAIVMQVQAAYEELDRCIKTPVTDVSGVEVGLPIYGPGAYLHWSLTDPNQLVNGFTQADFNATFAPIVHGHAIADVAGLQGELDAKALISYVVDVDNALQAQITALDEDKANANNVVDLNTGQNVAGVKTFLERPRGANPPVSTTDLTNKDYVDQIFNSLMGVVFRGTINISAGDSALPPSPSNGDMYYVGVGGTITASNGSGAAAPVAVPAGSELIWSAPDNYWLYKIPTGTVAAADVTFNPTGNTIITATDVQAGLDQTDAALATILGDYVPVAGGRFTGSTQVKPTSQQTVTMGVESTGGGGVFKLATIGTGAEATLFGKVAGGSLFDVLRLDTEGVSIQDGANTTRLDIDTDGSTFTGPVLLDASTVPANAARRAETVVTDVSTRVVKGVGHRSSVYGLPTVDTGIILLDPSKGNLQGIKLDGNPSAIRPEIQAPYDIDGDDWVIDMQVDYRGSGTILSGSNLPASINLAVPKAQGGVFPNLGIYFMSFRRMQNVLSTTIVELIEVD